jgi:heat shock protein HslJ
MTMRRAIAAVAFTVAASACATMKSGGDVSTLTGVDWRLVEVRGQPAVPADVAKRPWLRFDGDSSRVFGSGGCNRTSGRYTLSGASIRIGPMIATKMACADQALNGQEQEFLSALDVVDRVDIEGDTLMLSKGSERLAMMVR